MGRGTGTDTLRLTAPAHLASTGTVAAGAGRILLTGWPTTVRLGDSVAVRLYATDPSGAARNVEAATAFSLAPGASIRFADATGTTITTLGILAGASASPQVWVHAVGEGPASVRITAAGYQAETLSTVVPVSTQQAVRAAAVAR